MNEKTINERTKHGGFRSLLKRALEIGVKIEFFSTESKLTMLTYGDKSIFLTKSNPPLLKQMGNFTRDKETTKIILEKVGINVPKGFVAESFDAALSLVREKKLRFPLIAKPTHGSRAQGVTWDIKSKEELEKAFEYFRKFVTESNFQYKTLIVEEMFIGKEYRVLTLDGKVISCVQKVPATVIGDGHSSIKELIDTFNKDRLEGFKIHIDSIVKETIKKNNFSIKTVIPKDYELRLRNNLNMSDGGRSIDVTEKMSDFFKDICVKATNVCGLSFSGIDIITEDISNSTEKYVILEVNPNPYYNMNEKPLVEGKGVDVSLLILKKIFPTIPDSSV